MSDTPRTDDQIGYKESTMTVVGIDFARQLERELQKAQADSAAMREALKHAHTAINYAVTTGFEDTIKTIVNAALSTNAGRELLAELQRLRNETEQLKTMLHSWHAAFDASQLTHAVARLETAEKERDLLRDDLAKAQAQCAELKSEVETWNECYRFISDFYAQNPPDRWLNSRARKAVTGKLT